ncbi:uncharacterized protein LOC114579943 [Dendrobium catenatum]|uniref:uncharacterized protein LOC114579943 n=1 Tax=Dendrobium catenatum TaxID=906689 RepID=UPI0010A096D9|nr:uncharacterized protein LOC114579943 [Dendrobium catenatum]
MWNVRGFNRPEKVLSCKRLINSFKLDMLCLLETRIHAPSLLGPFFDSSHSLFPNEVSLNNFNLSSSGRIWIKWDENKLNFVPTLVTSQLINGLVTVGSLLPFQISIVYASNNATGRKDLWSSLNMVAPSSDLPWAIFGVFNCCRFANEKSGGSAIHHSHLVDINNMIFANCLVDMHSVGNFFTWYNQQALNPIFIKLDRALDNENWMKKFPNAYCSFQNPSCSDHSPIILHSGVSFKPHHRFMFKNFWTKNDIFWAYLLNAISLPLVGNPLSHFCYVLRHLKGAIKNQDWANSNSLNTQLEFLHDKQQNILDLLMSNPLDDSLVASLKDTNLQISDVSSKQASWIIQRAKLNWLQHGEDDIKFLYGKIRSRIGSSKSLVNLLTANPNMEKGDVINSIIKHFQDLFNPAPPYCTNLLSLPICTIIPYAYANFLVSPILDDEIKAAVFKGSSKSSPGYLPSGIKTTALAIIPKHRNVVAISDYRPISLCNTLYKIIAKIIAHRMSSIMPIIVKETQAGFVKARLSTDSILLASDILSFVNKKGAGNMFCAKIDIKKAFDSVSREFLLARMLQKGFPKPFINWIKACISNVNFSVIIEGALEGFFSSSAGLRQGCPLSPFLFCLVMDVFSNLLDERGFKGFKVDNFHISHLLYADDVLILGEATLDNCRILSSTLEEFANVSRLHINYDKSSVMFSKNTRNRDLLCQVLSICNVSHKLVYLGIPISFTRLKVEDFLPLMDKIHKKFMGWKANLLSFAGRLQYLKFTIQNTIAYWIRGSILPKTVFKFFRKTCSKFLFFGDITSLKKLHMVSWDSVCLPKQKGGLGIPSINALQFAFNCSVIWRMYNCSSPLSNWLSAHYISPWRPPSTKDSKFWISICKTAVSVKKNFTFIITPNASISVCWDHWCNNTTLAEFVGGASLDYFPHPFLKSYISNSNWVFNSLTPQSLKIALGSFQIVESAISCLMWKNDPKPKFKDFVEDYYMDFSDCSWHKFIWHKKHILKNSVYVWLALVGGLKIQDALRHRNIYVPVVCSLCNSISESVNHLFFECTYSFDILNSLIPGTRNFLLRPTILQLFNWMDNEFSGAFLSFYLLIVRTLLCDWSLTGIARLLAFWWSGLFAAVTEFFWILRVL